MLQSQLSTVQRDHHRPTYWSFSLFLYGLSERLLFFWVGLKKTQYIHTRAQKWGCAALQCATQVMANLSNSLRTIQWCVQRESAGYQAGQYQQDKNCWPSWQSISTPRSKAEVGTTSSDTHGLPQPCVEILHGSFQCHCINYILWFMISWKPTLAVFNDPQELWNTLALRK